MPLDPGVILNQRYRILSILGQGGMGAVYHAIDLNLGVDVALKENLYLSEEFARQFKREAAILATIKHSNLPRVSDHFEIKGQGQYLVMDYMDGEDLRIRMDRNGVLTDSETVSIGAAICDALDYLHSRQPAIIHRDLKPGNIRIAADGHISLVDFGLAKLDMGEQETTTGARAMTPGYSPPEQYGTARTDTRSDIYSLGATLYASLSGCAPEDSLSIATGYAQLTSLRNLNPIVPKKLALVIERAMEIHPEDRYQSALELKKALLESIGEKVTDSRVFLVSPPPIDSPDKKSGVKPSLPRSKPAVIARSSVTRKDPYHFLKITGITAFVVLGVAAATTLILINQTGMLRKTPTIAVLTESAQSLVNDIDTDNEETQTPSKSETATVAELDTNLIDSLATILAPSLPIEATPPTVIDKSTNTTNSTADENSKANQPKTGEIAFVSIRTDLPQIWIMNSEGNSLRQVTNLKAGACQPDWSPDGKKLVFISPCYKREYSYPKANLFIIDADGTNLESLDPGYGGNYDPAWSPDNQQIAFTKNISGISQIYFYNINDKTVSAVTDDKYPSKHPAWSADGKYLAYINTKYSGEIWIRDNASGTSVQYTRTRDANNNWPVWEPSGNKIFFTQSPLDPFLPWLAAIEFPYSNTPLEYKIPRENFAVPSPASDVDISSDGNWLVFEAWPEGNNHDIYIMNDSGENVFRLTDDERLDFQPVWRPN
jgi:serine/threonine protein kinase